MKDVQHAHGARRATDQLGLDPRAENTRAQAADGSHAVRLPAPGADAGRPPGQGRDGRLGHPDAGRIMPAAVGVDIGCGMIAVRTQFTADDLAGPDRRELRGPSSGGPAVGRQAQRCADRHCRDAGRRRWRPMPSSTRTRSPALAAAAGHARLGQPLHRGDRRRDGRVWLFLHSGSRGVGNKIAQQPHRDRARADGAVVDALPDRDLAYLVEGTAEFWAYIRDLRWAQTFALLNREEMMDRVVGCLRPVGSRWSSTSGSTATTTSPSWRSTSASRCGCPARARSRPGRPAGLIPGSMGTACYVVVGKGDALSLNSSPHGAGRNYSRSAARQPSPRAAAGGDGRHRVPRHRCVPRRDPAAYKDIDQVMADAADLVEIRHTLRQLVNVKGD